MRRGQSREVFIEIRANSKEHANSVDTINRRFSIAPMMDWSDHHCRYFWRLLTRQSLLYTEMVTTGAMIHGDRERFLHFGLQLHPQKTRRLFNGQATNCRRLCEGDARRL